jgi:putative permease
MANQITKWIQKRFSNTELVTLLLSILILVVLFLLFGHLLMPVVVSIIIAYLLDGLVKRLTRWKIPHTISVIIVFTVSTGLFLLSLFVLLPLMWDQLINLVNELPNQVKRISTYFNELSLRYPKYISRDQIQSYLFSFQSDFARYGKVALAYSLATLSSVMMWIVYLVLVPLMVFFFLKDRDQILLWLSQFLPKKRAMVQEVWNEVNTQIANYIRAKVLEVIIVAVVSVIAFALLGLNYAILLGVLVGLSSLIPYVGGVLVTIPVIFVAYLEWGFNAPFFYTMIAYAVIMTVDGNVLAPLLFSETLKIHAVAVIIAILIFGGIWGFWGIFFAIPLATVVKAVLNVWLKNK